MENFKKLYKIIAPKSLSEQVFIPKFTDFVRKFQRIREDGLSNLQIISDFDFTLTKKDVFGKLGKTSVTLAQVTGKDKERQRQVEDLMRFYSPIERSNTLNEATKSNYMKEWWIKSSDMLISDQLDDSSLTDIVLNSEVYLRYGIDELLEKCQTLSLPFIVVSAGFGNVIQKYFEILKFSNVQIYSNFLLPNKDGVLDKRSDPFVVSSEKNMVLLHKPVRRNFILLGDMPSDSWMIEKLSYEESIKIGYANTKEDLVLLQDFFDVVILNDGNLLYPVQVLESLSGLVVSP